MKMTVSILGAVLLASAVAVAQSSSTGSKASTKQGQTSSSYNSGSTNSSTAPKAGNSGFDAGLPQSDTSASSSSSSQNGTSATNGSMQSSSGSMQSSVSDEISNGPVAETVSDSSAVIGWSTRSSASSTSVKYGTNRANLSQTTEGTDGADGKNHHARLQGLSPSTRYYFQVAANGQPVGGIGTFKTTASGDTPVQSKAVIPQK